VSGKKKILKCCLHSLKDSAQEDGNVAWTKRSCLRGHVDDF
jgi:hypothetical protein